jgi:thymidine kinase
MADEVELLDTPCTVCGRAARFSQRMVPVVDGNLVGGPAEFEPRCPAHFTPLPPPAPVYE